MIESNSHTEEIETKKEGGGAAIWIFAIAHMLCCGLPLLVLSGVSIMTFFKSNAFIAITLAAIGVIGFIWFLKRGCATCPRNEGRCIGGSCRTSLKNSNKFENK